MPFILPSGENGLKIVDGVLPSMSLMSGLQPMPSYYATEQALQESQFFVVGEDEASPTILNAYIYDDIKGYIITSGLPFNPSILQTLTITASLQGSKIYFSSALDPQHAMVSLRQNKISIPVASVDENGYILVDTDNQPIPTYLDAIDYDTANTQIIIPRLWEEQGIKCEEIVMWTEVDAAGVLGGTLNYTLTEVKLDEVVNSLFFIATDVTCEADALANVYLKQTLTGSLSPYFQTLYISNYLNRDNLDLTEILDILKETTIASIAVNNTSTYTFHFDGPAPNIERKYTIWGMSTKSTSNDGFINAPTINTTWGYFTSANIAVNAIPNMSEDILINRKFQGSFSGSFEALYINNQINISQLDWTQQDTIENLLNAALTSCPCAGITSYILPLASNNTANNYTIWGFSSSSNANIQIQSPVDQYPIYFIHSDLVQGSTVSGAQYINRNFSGSFSPAGAFEKIYLITETELPSNSSTISEETIRNLQAQSVIFIPTESTSYSFTLSKIENSAVNYYVWGLSTDSSAAISKPTLSQQNSTSTTTDCLTGDTLITLYDRSKKRLDEITINDVLLSQNNEPAYVMALVRNFDWPYHTKYHFDNGSYIDEVREHYAYNVEQGFFANLKDWKVGEHGLDENNNMITFIGKEIIEERVEKFGIWTNTGIHYANGILASTYVHNKDLIEDMDIEQIISVCMSACDPELFKQLLESGVSEI